ncbi:hypothetical protein KBC80_00445 [Candidatus Woesebacteria bacterium]|jgi:hypothetical protein|nr:hypothetical protein [Candidatus Woesebacteria bacterium]
MSTLSELESRIKTIEDRNASVELDKLWETSLLRKVLLMVFTYISLGLYMYAIGVENPWVNAVVPTIGFFLSTLTLPIFKTYWKHHLYKK